MTITDQPIGRQGQLPFPGPLQAHLCRQKEVRVRVHGRIRALPAEQPHPVYMPGAVPGLQRSVRSPGRVSLAARAQRKTALARQRLLRRAGTRLVGVRCLRQQPERMGVRQHRARSRKL